MFSRSGATTITLHRVFNTHFGSIEEIEHDIKNARKHRGFAAGTESTGDGHQGDPRMPKMEKNAENQDVVSVPGLAEELESLERHFRQ